jgi:putative ABC transport system substrate-binding protein
LSRHHGRARRAAEQVASILRGAEPADIPVEEHAPYELVLNLRTAKALGITFPSRFASARAA